MRNISQKDRARLRELAARQAEIAHSPEMVRLYGDWKRHGRFERDARPMLTVELFTFADEIIPGMLTCEDAYAREIEAELLSQVIPHNLFGDDTPVRDHFRVSLQKEFVPFGLKPRRECSGDSGYVGVGHRFVPYIEDIEEDWHMLGKSTWSVDLPATQTRIDELNGIFGDLLPVRRAGEMLHAGVAEDIIHMMDMEHLYVAMYDSPELVHRMVDMLIDDYGEYFAELESRGLLLPTAGDEPLPEGSYCFTDSLPDSGEGLHLNQIWGYMDAEEMNDVSAVMYKEFIVDHYKRLTGRFGALSFGCCEAMHRFWDDSVEHLPSLRKVSVSAWCDERFMGERLRGKNVVFLKKPTANLLGVKNALDEDAVTRYYRDTAEAASGCRLEITQRDVYLLYGNIPKVRRYVELARAALERYWKP